MPPKNKDKNNSAQGSQPAAPQSNKRRNTNTYCQQEGDEWYCYKMDGGQATQCSGPFDTKEECEACGCGD
jgi:hypothetical protein